MMPRRELLISKKQQTRRVGGLTQMQKQARRQYALADGATARRGCIVQHPKTGVDCIVQGEDCACGLPTCKHYISKINAMETDE